MGFLYNIAIDETWATLLISSQYAAIDSLVKNILKKSKNIRTLCKDDTDVTQIFFYQTSLYEFGVKLHQSLHDKHIFGNQPCIETCLSSERNEMPSSPMQGHQV